MLKNYTLTFTEDKTNYISRVVPAESLAEAYLIIQDKFPGAEITDYTEGNKAQKESWPQALAKLLLSHASFDELCAFVSSFDEEKREDLAKAIWNEYHNGLAKGGVI